MIGAAALASVPAALPLIEDARFWWLALVPLAIAIAVAIFAWVRLPEKVVRQDAVTGAIVMALVSAIPAIVAGVVPAKRRTPL